jgi:hypothetical protein
VIFISGYAVFDFGFIGTEPVKDSSLNKIIGSATKLEQDRERDRADVLVRNLAAAREEIALRIERENAAQAKALEVKRIADAKQKELKQALDEKTARADNRPIQESNAAPAITGVVPNTQSLDDVTTGTVIGLSQLPPTRPSQSQPTSATAVTPNNATTDNANALVAQTPSQPKCDVSACTSAYRSFRKSDCTYQPSGGPRRLCTNGVVRSEPSGAPDAAATSNSNANANRPSNARCNVNACAAAYGSFNPSDCTYQPYHPLGGPRRLCTK